ncbi:glyoxalase [Candidatus Bathyarchaeota archaeon]|nr:glyoxalase [Candidatus Bathyarchaeota archaeon]
MLGRIGLITILTTDITRMKLFYSDVMGFECIEDLGNYVEFRNKGVRFALTTPKVMYEGTEHESYNKDAKGQRFELAFPLSSAEEVEKVYDEIVRKGATPIKTPKLMPWGRTTAFFADPEGNIHELYSLREGEKI